MTAPVALVTGAGSGVGRACALALAEAGYALALTGRRPGPLRETATALAGEGHMVHPADVGDPEQVKELFAAVEGRFGRLDLLFNNAGRNGPSVEIDELPVEEWDSIVAVNLTGSFLCARAAFALMKRQNPGGGRIINNGSISAHTPRPMTVPYTATKHAITGLTKALALDGRAHGIACGQIDIGNAATELTERMAAGILQADGSRRAEPRMDAADVGRTLVYMASLPPSANALFVTVMATNMPFVGRG